MKALVCLLFAVLAVGALCVFLFIPQAHGNRGIPSEFAITAKESTPLYRNVRLTNVTGHPDRVAMWLPHGVTGTPESVETTCCQFIRDGAHWVDRNEPYRIYQAPSRSFVAHVAEAGAQWEEKSGGHRILGAAVESGRTFDNVELARIDQEETNFVARADLTYMDDNSVLGVTRLVMDRGMKHIFQWGIIINTGIDNICDAIHNESCYDQKTLFVHEVGHVYGLDDLYNAQCALTSMYGYLATGETRGRQLDMVTRNCVSSLYSNLPLDGETDTEVNAGMPQPLRDLWFVLLHMLFVLLT
jgi:hypothetical protein